jgi:hypothetical protein
MFDPCGLQGGVDRAAAHAALDQVLDASANDGTDGPASGAVLGRALKAAQLVTDVVDGARVAVVAAFDASGEWAAQAHRSPVSWTVAETGVHRRAAGATRRVCLAVAARPLLAAEAAGGRLSQAHLRLLVDARRAPVEDLYDRDEADLITEAKTLTADGLQMRLARWYHDALVEAGRNEPDRPEPSGDGNRLRLVQGFGGRGLFDGELTPDAFASVTAAVEAEISRRRASGALENDPRCLGEIQGDVLVDLVTRGAARPDGTEAAPLIVATCDLDTLLRRGGVDDPAERTRRRADIAGAGPVADDVIAELATAADIALLVTDGGHPLWLGRSRRLATTAQRHAAVAASDGHCYWPGCTVSANTCQIDHLLGWDDQGPTDIDNLAPLCRWHNRLKHRGRYRATREPDGSITITDARGSPVTSRYHHTQPGTGP